MAQRFGLFARKSLEEAVAETEHSGFRRALGPLDLTSIGVAGIVGAGIFFFLGAEARTTGPAVIFSLLLAGVTAVLAALSYAEFASLIPGNGSAYLYAYAALGRFPAFVMGWLILNAYAVGNMVVAISWSAFAASGLSQMELALPAALTERPTCSVNFGEFDVACGGGLLNLPAAFIMLAVTLITVPKIRESTIVNNALVALKILIVLFVIVFGLSFIRPGNYEPFSPAGTSGVLTSAAVLFFAYLGFDTVAATGDEARNPRRDLPLGIILSVGVSMLLYIAMAAVVTGMTSAAEMPLLEPPVSAGFARAGHPWAAGLITAGALIGLVTVIYAFQLALARILNAMARDGFWPSAFARLNPRTGTPVVVTLWSGGLTALGAAILPLDRVIDMTVLASIFSYVLVAGGVLVLKVLRPEAPRRFRVHWVLPAVSIALLLGIAFAGIQDVVTHLAFWMWVGLGLMLYGFYAHRRQPWAADWIRS